MSSYYQNQLEYSSSQSQTPFTSSSPSFPRQFTKKYDLIQKIQKLGVKPKSKYDLSRVNQSPKSPSNRNYQYQQQEYFQPKAPKFNQNQNDIISNLKSELLNIKQDVSKLMGKEKEKQREKERDQNITQSIKNQRVMHTPHNYDNQSLASQNVNMYRYKNKGQGFKLRSQESNRSQQYDASISGIDAMSQVPSLHKKKQTYNPHSNYKSKMYLSPKGTATMDYINIENRDKAFKKSPKVWETKGMETSIISMRNIHNEELQEAHRTIRYLEGIIEDSNNIRKGLENKISSMKKYQLNSNTQQCKILKQKLQRQQHNRLLLEEKILYLTEQIELLQDQMSSPRSRQQNKSKSNSRVVEENRTIQIYQAKIKNLIDTHNRETFGLKTENKLHKLNLQKYQLKQRAGFDNSPKKQSRIGISEYKLSLLIKPHKKILSFVNIQMQTDLSQQRQIQTTITKSVQTDRMKQLDLLDIIKQQMLETQTVKYQLELKQAELESENATVKFKLEVLNNQFESYKQRSMEQVQLFANREEELLNEIKSSREQLQQCWKSIDTYKTSIKTIKDEKNALEKQKQISNKEKLTNSSQLKIDQDIINQLNLKIINIQQQWRVAENKYKHEIADKKTQISNYVSDNRRLTELYTEKCKLDQNNSMKYIDIGNLQQRNQELAIQNQRLQSQLQELDYQYRAQISEYKLQLKSRKSSSSINTEIVEKGFDQSLKNHLSQIMCLKQQIQQNKQLIIQLKQQCRSLRTLADNNRAQLQIQKLRSISDRKNISVGFQIEIQNMKNELNYERKASNSISMKLKLFNQENKRKDQFLQKYILGKNISQEFKVEVTEFFRRYEEEFSIERLKERVYSETEMIQKLMEDNKILIKNICELREEAMRSQGGSLEVITTDQYHNQQNQMYEQIRDESIE